MILRNVAIRHGRKALADPLRLSHIRFLTTETSTISQEAAVVERSIDNHMTETHAIEASINQLPFNHKLVSGAVTESDETVDLYNLQRAIHRQTNHLGSSVHGQYKPNNVLLNPPKPSEITLELLMASQAHLGHHTSQWNPANQRYIFGVRQGIHIIGLETIAAHLRRAAKVVEGVAYHGGLILFVGSRKGQASAIVKAAELAKGYHLFEKWIPGTITNGGQILKRCALTALDKDDNVVEDIDVDNSVALKPDLVVVMNPLENYVLLHECGVNNIPTIGVIDTNADPTWVTYPIPANDDSLRCIQVIAGVLGRAGEEGQRKRLQAASEGVVTWSPGLLERVAELDIEKEKRAKILALRRKSDAIAKEKERKQSQLEWERETAAEDREIQEQFLKGGLDDDDDFSKRKKKRRSRRPVDEDEEEEDKE